MYYRIAGVNASRQKDLDDFVKIASTRYKQRSVLSVTTSRSCQKK